MRDDLDLLDAIDPDRVEDYRHGTLVVIFTDSAGGVEAGTMLIDWHRSVRALSTQTSSWEHDSGRMNHRAWAAIDGIDSCVATPVRRCLRNEDEVLTFRSFLPYHVHLSNRGTSLTGDYSTSNH